MSTTELIESKIDRGLANRIAVDSGGLDIHNMGEAMEFAKLMAVSGTAVPAHCRNAPGLCLAICVQAMEWRMSPFAVANKSYVVNDRVAYESQLIHAVIEQRAPIQARLRHSFSGSGETRKCKVWATVIGETEPMEYESPEIKAIVPKNSPLWKSKPDLQLYYNTTRDWARMYFPDVIMGVYSDDEISAVAVRSVETPSRIAGVQRTSLAAVLDTPAIVVESAPEQSELAEIMEKQAAKGNEDLHKKQAEHYREKLKTSAKIGSLSAMKTAVTDDELLLPDDRKSLLAEIEDKLQILKSEQAQ
jgi:hypothetical protein